MNDVPIKLQQNMIYLEFPSTQISIISQIFDFMSRFCREFFADSNATSIHSFIIFIFYMFKGCYGLKTENSPK